MPSLLKQGPVPSVTLYPLSTQRENASSQAAFTGVSGSITMLARRPTSEVLNASMSIPGSAGGSFTSPTPENHSIACCTSCSSPARRSTSRMMTGAV